MATKKTSLLTPAQKRRLSDMHAEHASYRARKDTATAAMGVIEGEIIRLIGMDWATEDGPKSKTFEGDSLKVSLSRSITAKVDDEVVIRLRSEMPRKVVERLFRPTFKLDGKEAARLKEEEPDVWARLSEAITEKEGKTSVKFSSIKEGDDD